MVKSGLRKISGIDVATQQRANFYLQMFLGRGLPVVPNQAWWEF